MRFLTVVMAIFLINVSMAAINAAGMFTGYNLQPSEMWFSKISKNSVQADEYFQSAAVQDTSSNFGFGDFVKGFSLFVAIWGFGIVVVPYVFIQFGMPAEMATILSLPIYLIYISGLAYFISNRGTKSMD